MDLLSNRPAGRTEEHHIRRGGYCWGPRIPPQGPGVAEDCSGLSANQLDVLSITQPALSSLQNLGSCSQGSCRLPPVVLIPLPKRCSASVLGSGRKNPLRSLTTSMSSCAGHWLGFGVTVYRLSVSLCFQSPHLLLLGLCFSENLPPKPAWGLDHMLKTGGAGSVAQTLGGPTEG